MRAFAAAPLLAAFALAAQESPRIPDPMPVDASPTPFACTLEKLLLGERCILEVEPKATRDGPAQTQQNIAWAGGAAARPCAAAAVGPGEKRADQTLRLACEKDVAALAINACGLDGRAALQDEAGRLGVAGRGCAEELQRVIARTRAQAAVGLACCRCLASSHCGPPLLQCASELAELAPGAGVAKCLGRCPDACAFARPPAPEEAPAAATRARGQDRRPEKI